MNRGVFVTFEGGEGSGKSTLSKIIKDRLEADGYEVVWTREPGGVPIAEQIREILLNPDNKEMDPHTEAILYAAARNQHTREKIIPALAEGKIVICDRYLGSSLAYQGWARSLGIEAVEDLNDFGIKGFRPDIEFFIDVLPELGFRRIAERPGGKDRLEQEDMEFHNGVYSGFIVESTLRPYSVRIDGTWPIEEVADKVYEILKDKIIELNK